ncbi:hypothetical protein NA78x_006057 [Anatilimnocola sp. NA78]|uniref:hypothetical protein n=1 Tax=Anatilimnocola sp. NA78 TaxID=3415683 RepID=UPI003CE544B1
MDSQAITEAARASRTGSSPFPEIVTKLISAGVEYYHVDYVGRCVQHYDGIGARVTTPLDFEGLPAVAAEFDATELRAAIFDSQRNGQSFRDFSARAMKAGVQSYYAFLRGRRVTYLARTGDQHTEWFPGAEPQRD